MLCGIVLYMLTFEMSFFISMLFLFGSVIGSFLLVVADRYVNGKNFLKGRSTCDHCGKILSYKDLVPFVSYLVNKGQSRCCQKKLSVAYPLYELLAGVLCVGLCAPALLIGSGVLSVGILFSISAILLILIRVDSMTMTLPDGFIYTLFALCVIARIVARGSIEDSAFGVIAGSGFLYMLWLITSGKGIGFGDVKLMIPLGLLFGLHAVVTLLFVAFFIGGLVGMLLIISKQAHGKTAIPFGPFLAISAYIIMVFPDVTHRFFTLLGVE